MSARIAVAGAVAWMAVGGVLPARLALAASDAEQGEALIREGIRVRSQDQTARALPLFEKAYKISPTPRAAAQLGLCELELGHYVTSERHLGEALASPGQPWIAKNRAILQHQREAATANIGELTLSISPADATVLLNNEPVDRVRLGAPLRLDKGSVHLQVRALGFQSAQETIVIVGGKRDQRAFSLVPEAPSPVAAAALPAPTAATQPAGADPGVVLDTTPPTPAAPARPLRLAAWITAGAAVGALALGTAEAFNAAGERDAFNSHTGSVGGVVYQDCGTANLSAACKPLKDGYDEALTWSVVGFAMAGALAATSAVLFVLSPPDHEGTRERGDTARAFACVPDVGARGFGCAVRF
ncbi:MAG TPA: hypothetical protein VI456_15845 [Polyangia bacterium]